MTLLHFQVPSAFKRAFFNEIVKIIVSNAVIEFFFTHSELEAQSLLGAHSPQTQCPNVPSGSWLDGQFHLLRVVLSTTFPPIHQHGDGVQCIGGFFVLSLSRGCFWGFRANTFW